MTTRHLPFHAREAPPLADQKPKLNPGGEVLVGVGLLVALSLISMGLWFVIETFLM